MPDAGCRSAVDGRNDIRWRSALENLHKGGNCERFNPMTPLGHGATAGFKSAKRSKTDMERQLPTDLVIGVNTLEVRFGFLAILLRLRVSTVQDHALFLSAIWFIKMDFAFPEHAQ